VAHPKKHWPMVEASRDEASHAVRLYNDATDIRSFEGFVVHMHLAWLTSSTPSSRGTKSTTATGSETTRAALKGLRRAEQWELAHSVRERWPDPRNPVRANLDFFIPCAHDPWLCKVSHATYGSFRSREELAARSSVASWSRQRIRRPHG
jgi:hypothetical protein